MILERLHSGEACRAAGQRAYELVQEIFPICRSITGQGVRDTLRSVGERIPLAVYEVPSGKAVFDWEVPPEWNIRDAYIKDAHGRRIVDFRQSNLHVVSYSIPVDAVLSLEELRPHLHSLPGHPDWIPYRTSYYKRDWGFCLRHRDLQELGEGRYEVRIDSTLEPGSLTYAECRVQGALDREVIVFTHVCHPSLANDNASGIAVVTELARALAGETPRYTYRFVFAPGTIGAITWLSCNEPSVGRIAHGLVLGLLGDPGPLTYKLSARGEAAVDRAAVHVLQTLGSDHRVEPFSPYGYDERQFCSPGFDLPVGRLTRSPNDGYPQYHTSADDLSLVRGERLGESIQAAARIIAALDADTRFVNLSPKCEPRLGKRNLYRPVGGAAPGEREHAMLWVLNQSNGSRSLLAIAERSGIAFHTVRAAADDLERVGLLRELGPDSARAPGEQQ